ncbi:MAG: HutP family protein [Clostridia bacterium]|nr:hut operon positive regulator HutP [Oscillospiraceae bacterium]MBQ7032567.1 HutP family protein [Clostridia bacterium]
MKGSKEVATCAIQMAMTPDRSAEQAMKKQCAENEILVAAADFGGEFITSVNKLIERTVVAARREGLISASHGDEGAVAGAAREAVSQIVTKAIGLNVGGKIGIARSGEHVCVCMFFGIGLLHLNEMAIGLGHRAL